MGMGSRFSEVKPRSVGLGVGSANGGPAHASRLNAALLEALASRLPVSTWKHWLGLGVRRRAVLGALSKAAPRVDTPRRIRCWLGQVDQSDSVAGRGFFRERWKIPMHGACTRYGVMGMRLITYGRGESVRISSCRD
jgi:hypothetical protein